jgi:hypothetical protein
VCYLNGMQVDLSAKLKETEELVDRRVRELQAAAAAAMERMAAEHDKELQGAVTAAVAEVRPICLHLRTCPIWYLSFGMAWQHAGFCIIVSVEYPCSNDCETTTCMTTITWHLEFKHTIPCFLLLCAEAAADARAG